MSSLFPASHRDLLTDGKRAFAVMATLMPDGSPQVTPLWFDTDGDLIRVNTARGRVKDHNMSARPRVALAILDPGNPYRYIQVRGTVISSSEAKGREHIDRLASKYRGLAKYDGPADQVRVMYVIRPESVSTMG